MAQTFWALNADTDQPLGFRRAASRSVVDATAELMDLFDRSIPPID